MAWHGQIWRPGGDRRAARERGPEWLRWGRRGARRARPAPSSGGGERESGHRGNPAAPPRPRRLPASGLPQAAGGSREQGDAPRGACARCRVSQFRGNEIQQKLSSQPPTPCPTPRPAQLYRIAGTCSVPVPAGALLQHYERHRQVRRAGPGGPGPQPGARAARRPTTRFRSRRARPALTHARHRPQAAPRVTKAVKAPRQVAAANSAPARQ
jgi:hypothetical protein